MGNLGGFLDSWVKESRCLTQLNQETEGLRATGELRRKRESKEAGGENTMGGLFLGGRHQVMTRLSVSVHYHLSLEAVWNQDTGQVYVCSHPGEERLSSRGHHIPSLFALCPPHLTAQSR